VALPDDRGIGLEVIPKYSIPTRRVKHDDIGIDRGEADQKLAIQVIWVAADSLLENAGDIASR